MQPIFIGRKSLAEQIWEKYAEEPKRQETKPTTNFYDNITNIQNLAEDSQLIQYRVFMTRD